MQTGHQEFKKKYNIFLAQELTELEHFSEISQIFNSNLLITDQFFKNCFMAIMDVFQTYYFATLFLHCQNPNSTTTQLNLT